MPPPECYDLTADDDEAPPRPSTIRKKPETFEILSSDSEDEVGAGPATAATAPERAPAGVDPLDGPRPETREDRSAVPPTAAAAADGEAAVPPTAAAGSAGGAQSKRACATCGVDLDVRVSRSAKNPGRKYYKCANKGGKCDDGFMGWADDAAAGGAQPKKGNIGHAGSSYVSCPVRLRVPSDCSRQASIKLAEQEETAGAAKRARERFDGDARGSVVGFDRAKRVVAKEDARRDPKAFKAPTAAALRSIQRDQPTARAAPAARAPSGAGAAQMPSGAADEPSGTGAEELARPPPSAADVRAARLARFAHPVSK
ncbi:hypothetical protein M885DRAFT_513093 [Pelagophyceae sp. CCMP2097]|nr:hypothetical protein M885DRAFT_513093 [Pelagophyceae sp. CCMP2097]